MQKIVVALPEGAAGSMRIDRYLAETLGLCSRSQLKIRLRKLLHNGREAKPSRAVKSGDILEIELKEAPEINLEPEPLALEILYEDENVAVLNKQAGMVVHPGCGNPRGTLVNALLFRYAGMAGQFPGERVRPGIVHRLDKDTSGVLIVAKTAEAHQFLARQFSEGKAGKTYLAIVKGRPSQTEGRVQGFIRRDPSHRQRFAASDTTGRRAVTRYRVLEEYPACSLLALFPRTGRTHQLRVHMLSLGCPILGDPIYSRRIDLPLLLHAYRLRIRLPGAEGPKLFRAPLPKHFREALHRFRGNPSIDPD